jgi:hypothetical protein
MCALARGFLQKQDFTERNLHQSGLKLLRKKMHHVGSADKANCTHIEPISSQKNCPLCMALDVRQSTPLREILLLRTRWSSLSGKGAVFHASANSSP